MDSEVKSYIEGLVFPDKEVLSITLENRTVDELNEYIFQFRDQYDLDKVSNLPSDPIRIGDIKVRDGDET